MKIFMMWPAERMDGPEFNLRAGREGFEYVLPREAVKEFLARVKLEKPFADGCYRMLLHPYLLGAFLALSKIESTTSRLQAGIGHFVSLFEVEGINISVTFSVLVQGVVLMTGEDRDALITFYSRDRRWVDRG